MLHLKAPGETLKLHVHESFWDDRLSSILIWAVII